MSENTENQKPEVKQAGNVITVLSTFVDNNLSLVRGLSAGLAVAGLIITARSIRLITKFGSLSEIPAHFIEKNVSIRGRVRSVTDKGLDVEHVPIHVPFLSALLTKRQVVPPLRVSLAGVDLTPQGRDWLADRLKTENTVWLRLISRQDDSLNCLVSLSRGPLFTICLNEELLRLGLGRTAPLHGLDPHSQIYWRLQTRLLKCERRAEKKGQGLWKKETLIERVMKMMSTNPGLAAKTRVMKWLSRTKDQ